MANIIRKTQRLSRYSISYGTVGLRGVRDVRSHLCAQSRLIKFKQGYTVGSITIFSIVYLLLAIKKTGRGAGAGHTYAILHYQTSRKSFTFPELSALTS